MKYADEPQKSGTNIWNLFQSDGKAKVEKERIYSLYKTYKLIILATHDDSRRMNSVVYRNITSANLQRKASNLIGRNFIMQQNNAPKHTANTTKDLIREQNGSI